VSHYIQMVIETSLLRYAGLVLFIYQLPLFVPSLSFASQHSLFELLGFSADIGLLGRSVSHP